VNIPDFHTLRHWQHVGRRRRGVHGVLTVRVEAEQSHIIQIVVSPTGRNMTIRVDGQQWAPPPATRHLKGSL